MCTKLNLPATNFVSGRPIGDGHCWGRYHGNMVGDGAWSSLTFSIGVMTWTSVPNLIQVRQS